MSLPLPHILDSLFILNFYLPYSTFFVQLPILFPFEPIETFSLPCFVYSSQFFQFSSLVTAILSPSSPEALTKTHENQRNCEKIPCASILTLLRGSNLSGLLTDENATRICSTTISQFVKSRRELSSCKATSLRLPPFFDLETVTLASGGGAPLCVSQDPVSGSETCIERGARWGGRGGVGGRRDVYIRLDVGFWVDEARVSDAFEIKNVVRARFPVHVLPPSRGRKGDEGFFPLPLATTATKTENVVKLRNILSTLFTSEDKDRRPSLGPCPASSRSGLRCKRHGARFQAKRSDKKPWENVLYENDAILWSTFAAVGEIVQGNLVNGTRIETYGERMYEKLEE